jgi:hypothetical protein
MEVEEVLGVLLPFYKLLGTFLTFTATTGKSNNRFKSSNRPPRCTSILSFPHILLKLLISLVLIRQYVIACPVIIAALPYLDRRQHSLQLPTKQCISYYSYSKLFSSFAINVMDVTLPLIEKNCGPRSVAFAMASGGVLSLCVPVFVPLFYHLG